MGDVAAEILVADSDWRESDILEALSDAPANEDQRDDDDEIDARDGSDSTGTDSTRGEGGVVGADAEERSSHYCDDCEFAEEVVECEHLVRQWGNGHA